MMLNFLLLISMMSQLPNALSYVYFRLFPPLTSFQICLQCEFWIFDIFQYFVKVFQKNNGCCEDVRFDFKQLNTHTSKFQTAHDHQYQLYIALVIVYCYTNWLKNTLYGCFQWLVVLWDEFLLLQKFSC